MPAPSLSRCGGDFTAVVEDVVFLLERRVPPGDVAARVGSTPAALARRFHRAGLHDLAHPFDAEKRHVRGRWCPVTAVTVQTVDLRQAVQAVVAHASTDPEDVRLCRVRFVVDGQNVQVFATQGFTCGLSIVSVLDNHDGELAGWDLTPGACKDVLAMFKVSRDVIEDATLRFDVQGQDVHVQDVSGLFPGKAITLPRLPDHELFPDVPGILGQLVHQANWYLEEGLATSGAWLPSFVAASKAYREAVFVSPAAAGRPRFLVQVGESFIGMLLASQDDEQSSRLRGYRDQDWPRRLPTEPRHAAGEQALTVTVNRAAHDDDGKSEDDVVSPIRGDLDQ